MHLGEVSVRDVFLGRPSRGICRFLLAQFRLSTQIKVGWVRRHLSEPSPLNVEKEQTHPPHEVGRSEVGRSRRNPPSVLRTPGGLRLWLTHPT